jgi:MSHA biogenesis protein MshQ
VRWIVVVLLLLVVPVFGDDLRYLRLVVPDPNGTTFDTVDTNFTRDWDSSSLDYDDAVDKYVDLGFTFSFNGDEYTQVNISSNGVLYFEDKNNAEYNNQHIPHTTAASGHQAIVESIYPYWDDLNLGDANDGDQGTIKYDTLGSAPNRRFVVHWNKVPHYSNTGEYSLQVVLYENGDIRFRYDDTTDADGDSNGGATIGVQEDGTYYHEYSYNSSIGSIKDILYKATHISGHIYEDPNGDSQMGDRIAKENETV